MKDDKTFSASCEKTLKELKDCLKILSSVNTVEASDIVIGGMQATLAAYSIRITGVSVASDAEEGSDLAITYEYKWVPTDGSRAIPRWDTGVITTGGLSSYDICKTYVRIFRIVSEARKIIRTMPKQSVDL